MRQIFVELIAFLRDNEDTYFYDDQFDAEALESMILGYALTVEKSLH